MQWNRRPKGGRALKRMLKAGADPNARDGKGWSLLHHAAVHAAPGTINLLLEAGIDPNARKEQGRTFLYLAMEPKYEKPGVVERLLEAGADPNVKDNDGLP